MLTRALKSKSKTSPRSLSLQLSGGTISQPRAISTNSAIHRGIRESVLYPSHARRLQLPIESSVASRGPEGISRVSRREDVRPRRPNHAGQQDVEDMEESARQARKRVNEKLARYKRGGRAASKSPAAVLATYRASRHSDLGAKPGFLEAIIDNQTRDRRASSYDVERGHGNQYRGNRELGAPGLGQQAKSRSKGLEWDGPLQARRASSHGHREDSARDSPFRKDTHSRDAPFRKDTHSRDDVFGADYQPRSRGVGVTRQSEERPPRSRRGHGEFAEKALSNENTYRRRDEFRGDFFPL